MRTKVINIKHKSKALVKALQDAGLYEYVGRPSKWSNPFVVGVDGTRGEVVRKYEAWIRRQPQLMEALGELAGKCLGCWCKPLECHGDVLVKLVEERFGVNRTNGP